MPSHPQYLPLDILIPGNYGRGGAFEGLPEYSGTNIDGIWRESLIPKYSKYRDLNTTEVIGTVHKITPAEATPFAINYPNDFKRRVLEMFPATSFPQIDDNRGNSKLGQLLYDNSQKHFSYDEIKQAFLRGKEGRQQVFDRAVEEIERTRLYQDWCLIWNRQEQVMPAWDIINQSEVKASRASSRVLETVDEMMNVFEGRSGINKPNTAMDVRRSIVKVLRSHGHTVDSEESGRGGWSR